MMTSKTHPSSSACSYPLSNAQLLLPESIQTHTHTHTLTRLKNKVREMFIQAVPQTCNPNYQGDRGSRIIRSGQCKQNSKTLSQNRQAHTRVCSASLTYGSISGVQHSSWAGDGSGTCDTYSFFPERKHHHRALS